MNEDEFKSDDTELQAVDSRFANERPNIIEGRTLVPEHPAAIAPSPGDLKIAYHEALIDLHQKRGTKLPAAGYQFEVQDKAFYAFFNALADACVAIVCARHPKSKYAKNNRAHRNMHVVASAPGSGKSTLAKAFAVGLTRTDESRPYPLGSVFLVHHIATADAVFRELSALLPNAVAVFSTKHDSENNHSAKYAATFRVGELEKYPIVVVTHEFYMGIRGDHARSYTKGDLKFPRVVTFIDERASEIAVYDLDPLTVEGLLKHVQHDNYAPSEVLDSMLALAQFTAAKRMGELSIETPAHDRSGWDAARDAIGYLRTEDAARYVRSVSARNPRLDFEGVLGFANAIAEDRAFIARQNKGKNSVNFVGYDRALPRLPGMVLLDASADIDGITSVCKWRKHSETPPERYDRLEIIHVPSVAKGNLRRWLREPGHLQAYADHIRDLIVRYVAPGQKALVVCTKDVVRAEYIKNWSEHMGPFLSRTTHEATVDTEFTEGFAWSLDERQIVITWFGGYGIGSNVWRDADVVIVYDDFHLPQRTIKATLQGLKGHKATEGQFARTDGTSSKELEYLRDGHILRWMKQMALRGKAREMDEHGICGHQRLVITGDLVRMLAHKPKVFPGAKVKTEHTDSGQLFDRLIAVLLSPEVANEISTKEIGDKLGAEWGDISSNLRSHKGYPEVLEAIGWDYHRGHGRMPGVRHRML